MNNSLKYIFWFLIIIIAGIYISFSIIPHYLFETNAYDLGIFNQIIFKYSHGELGPSTLRHVDSLLGDHFELYLFLLSPFFYIFKSYTLLIFQISIVFLSAYGLYKFIYEKTKDIFYGWAASFIFLIFFGTLIAISFDYHNDIIGMAFLPWIFYFWEKKNIKYLVILAVLMSFAKEPFFLISAMIGFSLFLFEKSKKNKLIGFSLFLFSISAFLLVLKIIIPYFGTGEYSHWSYTQLGEGPIESLVFMIQHPIETFSLFYSDPLKIQSLKYFLVSGLCFSIFFPRYFIIFLPFLAEKYFSSNAAHWGLYFHYNILLAPLISISIVLFFYNFSKIFRKEIVSKIAVLFFIFGNIIITYNLSHIYCPEYLSKEYISQYETRKSALKAFNSITKEHFIIAVQGNYISHLVEYENLYILDNNILNNWYPSIILLDENTKNIWPFTSAKQLTQKRKNIISSGIYDIIFEKDNIYIFKKKRKDQLGTLSF